MTFNRFMDDLDDAAPADADAGASGWPEHLDGLPHGFVFKPKASPPGLYRVEDNDGDKELIWLCTPIRVQALTRGRSGEGWGRYVEVVDRDGRSHFWAIPMEMFAGDGTALLGELYRLGFDVFPNLKSKNALLYLLQRWAPEARAITSDRLGWTDNACAAFALGDGSVVGAANVVYQHEHASAAAAEMRAAGTPEGWRNAVAARCIGNPLAVASVSLAFAGPLLEPLGIDSGGLHLRGASSCGKSTIQRVAVSVWGSPRAMNSWRATDNGLEGLAAACNGTLLVLDELGEVSGRDAHKAVYMLANGGGKTRADRSGRARPRKVWRECVLSSGEISFADKMAEAGLKAKAGQQVRILDLAADSCAHGAFEALHGARDGAAFSDALKAAAAEHFGTAGPAFVRRLLDDKEATLQAARTALEGFSAEARHRYGGAGEGQVERAIRLLGVVAAAGELATEFGLTGWPPGMAADAALEALGLWLDGRGGAGAAEACEAVERTRAFLLKEGAARFEVIGATEDFIDAHPARPVHARAGWRLGELYFIHPAAWAEIHAGSDAKRAAHHVADAGFLETDADDRLTKRTPKAVPKRPRCYAVKASIMEGADD